ncbi:probable carboxylesterase 2 [Impatiens glandulifera]|uniref:probable carboxylesterase 2 n=1 Tax=Impatiens glandulifera TaxID=253017 RepID=UPI001FB05880|nr:probable carboxylesterase 2 [Impatiens glandulifera]
MTKFNPIFILSLFLILGTVSSCAKTCKEVSFTFFLNVYSNCTIERLVKSDHVPPHFDNETQVRSWDVVINRQLSGRQLSGRLYRPNNIDHGLRVPILIFFHGGGFLVGSPFDRSAQNMLYRLSSMGKFVILSVDYMLAPESKIPIPYRNGDETLKWLALQATGNGNKKFKWLKDILDFDRVFIGGQSSGGNIAYNVAMRFQQKKLDGLRLGGLIMIHPYVLTVEALPSLMNANEGMRNNITGLWPYVCPKTIGLNDTRVNPSLETNLQVLNPGKVLVCVAEKDPMIDAVKAFYDVLEKNVEKVEYYETFGKGHVFDNIFPNIVETYNLYEKIATFIELSQ